MDPETGKTAKPRRRWLRFSLRTMLIVVTLLSVLLGWVRWKRQQVRKEQATIAWVEEMGGIVSYYDSRIVTGEKSWWEKSTDKWFGERVWQVVLGNTQVSDLSPLAELKNLNSLYLFNTQVSDLSPLAELKNLVRLDLSNSQVIDLSPLPEPTSLLLAAIASLVCCSRRRRV